MPAVVLMMTSTSEARIRSTTSRYNATSREPLPVSGSRTWMCTMVAPARAAAMPDSAICSGCHRHVLGASDGVAGAGQRAGDHDVPVHGLCSFVFGMGPTASSRAWRPR